MSLHGGDVIEGTVESGAVFDEHRVYRYALWRRWSDAPALAFVGLNPSTADAKLDDPTIRRCRGFAEREGAGGLWMLNLFAFRATDPAEMRRAAHPIGPNNDAYLRDLAPLAKAVVACWGAHGGFLARGAWVSTLLQDHRLMCLKRTADGSPGHPLYLPANSPLVPYK